MDEAAKVLVIIFGNENEVMMKSELRMSSAEEEI